MRDHADQRAVRVFKGNAYDQSRTNLLRDAEVHLPYLSPFRHANGSPPRPTRGKKPPPKPRNRHPSNRQTWEHVRRGHGEAVDAPFRRVSRPRQEFGRQLVSCPEHTRAQRIEQASGNEKGGHGFSPPPIRRARNDASLPAKRGRDAVLRHSARLDRAESWNCRQRPFRPLVGQPNQSGLPFAT